jgi:hypothetical protein
MLKERLETREHQGEPLRRASHLFYKLVAVASEANLGDTNEGCTLLLRREDPFHSGGAAVSRPFDENAPVRFDGFRSYGSRDAVHFPLPLNLLASLQPTAAFGEPEFRGDVRVDKGLEHIGDRLANEHSGLCNGHLFEV